MLGFLPVGPLLPNQGFSVTQGRFFRDGTTTRLDLSMIAYEGQSQSPVDVLTGEDIVIGAAIALALAFTGSFLQGRRSQNDFVLWDNLTARNITNTAINVTNNTRVFDGEAWKEISRPDNYVFYNRKVSDRAKQKKDSGLSIEKTWVLVALLLLFVPIFWVEFFFALSRPIICDGGNLMSQPDWAEYLCSPVNVLGS